MANAKGWEASAEAWIASLGDQGDWSRRTVLDTVMLERALRIGGHFLDIGCGEGRFVRMLTERGLTGCGLDPVKRFIEEARARHPDGDYHIGWGEHLPFPDAAFDLVIAYLSLIDIADYRRAIREMVRIVKPNGHLLIANLTSYFSAGKWQTTSPDGRKIFPIDEYMIERASREQWRGIDVINWHRPLRDYMQSFLSQGLRLVFFDEPTPPDDGTEKAARYTRVPGFVVMQWQKTI